MAALLLWTPDFNSEESTSARPPHPSLVSGGAGASGGSGGLASVDLLGAGGDDASGRHSSASEAVDDLIGALDGDLSYQANSAGSPSEAATAPSPSAASLSPPTEAGGVAPLPLFPNSSSEFLPAAPAPPPRPPCLKGKAFFF